MTINGDTCLTCKVRNCSSLLRPCTIETLSAISTFKNSCKFGKGNYIFCQGEQAKGVYFIKKGVIKIEKKVTNERSFILKISGRGEIIGHRGHDGSGIHYYSAQALSEVVCCFVPMTFFKEILKVSPDLEKQLSEQYRIDLERMEQRSFGLACKSVREKVAEALLLVSEFYCYSPKRKVLAIDLSRQDIADLTGTTKEQVSATLKDFERQSWIRCSGKHFSFLDLKALKSLSGYHD